MARFDEFGNMRADGPFPSQEEAEKDARETLGIEAHPSVLAWRHGTTRHAAAFRSVHSHNIAIVLALVLALLVLVMLILGVRSEDRPLTWPASINRSSR